MSNCETCRFRGKYDRNPRSILGRIWKWHIGWCPGWKAYLKTRSDEKKHHLIQREEEDKKKISSQLLKFRTV